MKCFCLNTVLAAAVLVGISGCSEKVHVVLDPASDSSAFVEYERFKTLDDLEKASAVIVEAQFTGERDLHVIDSSSQGVSNIYKMSKSTVKVKQVHKGDDLSHGDQLVIYEDAYEDGDNYRHTSGYRLMDKGDNYLLFLFPVEREPHSYGVVGIYQGKFDTGRSLFKEEIDYYGVNKDLDLFNSLKKAALDRYK